MRAGAALACALGGAVLGVSLASADGNFDSRLSVYTDSDATTVVTPYIHVSSDVEDVGTFTAVYTADAITSASIDVVSNASRRIHEYRNEAEVGYSRALDHLTLSALYIFSEEHDYLSNTGSLSAAYDLFDKNSTLAAGVSAGANVVGRAGDPGFAKPLTVLDAGLSWTQVLSPTLIGQIGYEVIRDDGWQSSPYRYVPIGDPAMPIAKILETEPYLRNRNDLTAAANWAMDDNTTLGLDYRYYFDDWKMQAHTLDARVSFDLAPSWLLRITARGYTQNSAFFYAPRYVVAQTYMTTDRELSRLTEESAGVKLSYAVPGFGPTEHASFDAKVDLYLFQYPDFPLLPHRFAQVFELGMGAMF